MDHNRSVKDMGAAWVGGFGLGSLLGLCWCLGSGVSPKFVVRYCLGLQTFEGLSGTRGSTSRGPVYVAHTHGRKLMLAVDEKPQSLSGASP